RDAEARGDRPNPCVLPGLRAGQGGYGADAGQELCAGPGAALGVPDEAGEEPSGQPGRGAPGCGSGRRGTTMSGVMRADPARLPPPPRPVRTNGSGWIIRIGWFLGPPLLFGWIIIPLAVPSLLRLWELDTQARQAEGRIVSVDLDHPWRGKVAVHFAF